MGELLGGAAHLELCGGDEVHLELGGGDEAHLELGGGDEAHLELGGGDEVLVAHLFGALVEAEARHARGVARVVPAVQLQRVARAERARLLEQPDHLGPLRRHAAEQRQRHAVRVCVLAEDVARQPVGVVAVADDVAAVPHAADDALVHLHPRRDRQPRAHHQRHVQRPARWLGQEPQPHARAVDHGALLGLLVVYLQRDLLRRRLRAHRVRVAHHACISEVESDRTRLELPGPRPRVEDVAVAGGRPRRVWPRRTFGGVAIHDHVVHDRHVHLRKQPH
eukprot:scaffold55457_cov57-Phaeocystis_antarctica.AAC.1